MKINPQSRLTYPKSETKGMHSANFGMGVASSIMEVTRRILSEKHLEMFESSGDRPLESFDGYAGVKATFKPAEKTTAPLQGLQVGETRQIAADDMVVRKSGYEKIEFPNGNSVSDSELGFLMIREPQGKSRTVPGSIDEDGKLIFKTHTEEVTPSGITYNLPRDPGGGHNVTITPEGKVSSRNTAPDGELLILGTPATFHPSTENHAAAIQLTGDSTAKAHGVLVEPEWLIS